MVGEEDEAFLDEFEAALLGEDDDEVIVDLEI